MDLRRLGHGALQRLEREVGAARHLENRGLAPAAGLGGFATSCATSCGITTAPWRSAWTRSPERTIMPKMSTVPPNRDGVHPGVRGRDLAAQHLELGCYRIEVAHAAVGDQALAAERLVDRGLHPPQKQPKPIRKSTSWMIATSGRGRPRRSGSSRAAPGAARPRTGPTAAPSGSGRCARSRRSAAAGG